MFKKKKQPVRIEVELFNAKKEEGYTGTIEIPVGYTVLRDHITSDLTIKDKEGNIKQVFDFQAGFSVTFNYLY